MATNALMFRRLLCVAGALFLAGSPAFAQINVMGTTAIGSAPSTPWSLPVLIGGLDGNGNAAWMTIGNAGSWLATGNVASGATDAGNPVKIGGIYNTTQPTVTNGQRVDDQRTARGAQIVAPGIEGFLIGDTSAQVTLAASSVQTSGTNATATAVTGLGKYKQLQVALTVTAAAAAAGDTLDVYVDTSVDGGTTLFNVIHFTQVLGNGGAKKFIAVLDLSNPGTSVIAATSDAAAGVVRPSMFCDWMQVRYTIVDGGAHGQSFTFAVLAFGKA